MQSIEGEARRALITGIDGFTGRYVSAELEARGFEVHGTVQTATSASHLHQLDLRDLGSTVRLIAEVEPTHVIHLAAISFVATADVASIYQVNVIGSRNLFQALADAGSKSLRKVIVASSANVYGNTVVSPISEALLAVPLNDYAISKLAVEHLARIWGQQIPITVVRPFNYTGVSQSERFLIPKIVAAHRNKMSEVELGNLDIGRDFSDVRDIAQAYAALADADTTGIYNLCSGTSYTLHDILQLCEEISGHSLHVIINPLFVRDNEVRTLLGSNVKFRQLIQDWAPRPLSTTLKWMLAKEHIVKPTLRQPL